MTTTSISRHHDSGRRWSVRADLAFWTVTGAVAAAMSESLSLRWGVSRAVLLDVGLVFAILGPILLLGLQRITVTRAVLRGLIATNVILAPLAWAAAEFGWLGLTQAGNRALFVAGAVMAVLGAWQYRAQQSPR